MILQLINFGDWLGLEDAKPRQTQAPPLQPHEKSKNRDTQHEEPLIPDMQPIDIDLDSDRPIEELRQLHNAWRLSR